MDSRATVAGVTRCRFCRKRKRSLTVPSISSLDELGYTRAICEPVAGASNAPPRPTKPVTRGRFASSRISELADDPPSKPIRRHRAAPTRSF
jgi:hypothetical protein